MGQRFFRTNNYTKKLWPDGMTSYDIAELTGHPEWYVDQVSLWCFYPEDRLIIA